MEAKKTIRISSTGYCPRRIVLDLQGVEQEPLWEGTERAFAEGNMHEEHIIEWALTNLPGGPYEVDFTGEDQLEATYKDILVGHPDGVLYNNRRSLALIEVKALAKRSFQEIREKGVRVASPAYFAQVQGYMLAINEGRTNDPYLVENSLDGTWFVARNKDTAKSRMWDHHYEWIPYDRDFALTLVATLYRLRDAAQKGDSVPPPYNPWNDWQCRRPWCPFAGYCWPNYYNPRPEAVRKDELEEAARRYIELGQDISDLEDERKQLREALTSSALDGPVVSGRYTVEVNTQRRDRIDAASARQVLDKPTLAAIMKVNEVKTLKVQEVEDGNSE